MRTIRTEIRTSAKPEDVYQAWADPERLSQWLVDRAYGDVRPGGSYLWYYDRLGYQLYYSVAEALPAKKLTLQTGMPGYGQSALEISIQKDAGDTVVRLLNTGFLDGPEYDDMFEGVVSTWEMTLGVMKHYAERCFRQSKLDFVALRPATFEYEKLLPYYTTPDGVAQWMDTKLLGSMLVKTKREALFVWNETGGLLALKAMSLGYMGRQVGVQGTAWGPGRERVYAMDAQMGASLDKLVSLLGPAPGVM